MSFWESMGWGIGLGVLCILFLLVRAAWALLKRNGLGTRDGDVAEVAKELDLDYLKQGHIPEGVLQAVPAVPGEGVAGGVPLPLFRRRRGWDELDNVLRSKGDREPQLWMGDYTLAPAPRMDREDLVVTVTLIKSMTLKLPPFALRPSNLRETNVNEDIAARRFAIRFPSDEAEGIYQEFRENYLLLPDPEVAFGDEDGIRALFSEKLRAFFSERWALSVEGAGGWLLIYREAARVEWQDLESLQREAFELYELFLTSSRELAEVEAKRQKPEPPPSPEGTPDSF